MKKQLITWIVLPLALLAPQASTGYATGLEPTAARNSWTRAASMPAPVMDQLALVLHDGRVLVLGGEVEPGSPVPWVQLYDPISGRWSMGQDMQVARIGESATVLDDGRVLVAGGIGPDMRDLSSAEMFEPNTGTWTSVASLPQTRFSHSASLLPDGRLLVVAGIVNGSISRSTLIYDERLNSWAPGPSTHFGHAQQSSATLRDGRILIAGGYSVGSEVYDPRVNSWSEVGTVPFRAQPVMTILEDGSVLLAAGLDRRDRERRTAEIYEPILASWHATGELHTGRDAASGILLADGRVLLVGGRAFRFKILKTAELYDPLTGRWSAAASMHAGRVAASAVLLHDGRVLVCGGADLADGTRSCELYHA